METTWMPHEKHGRLTKQSDLPDTVFAFPKQRKEPLTDGSHVRNAIARFDQVTGVSDEDRALAFANIKKAAEHYSIDMTEMDWTQLGRLPIQAERRRTAEHLHARRQPLVKENNAMTRSKVEWRLSLWPPRREDPADDAAHKPDCKAGENLCALSPSSWLISMVPLSTACMSSYDGLRKGVWRYPPYRLHDRAREDASCCALNFETLRQLWRRRSDVQL